MRTEPGRTTSRPKRGSAPARTIQLRYRAKHETLFISVGGENNQKYTQIVGLDSLIQYNTTLLILKAIWFRFKRNGETKYRHPLKQRLVDDHSTSNIHTVLHVQHFLYHTSLGFSVLPDDTLTCTMGENWHQTTRQSSTG